MSGEETEVSLGLPEELAGWIDEQATEGTDREAVIRNLIAAYRSVSADEDVPEPSELQAQLADQREEYTGLVEDVRDRVIQVKKETDQKAPADHDHPELSEAVDQSREELAELERELDSLQESLAELEADLESGFENYEDVLEYLTDTTEEAQDHLDVLASELLDLRETTKELAADHGTRTEVDRLKLAANQAGVRTADCEDCGASVDVALLTDPHCPHCQSTFSDVKVGSGFFGSDKLVTGDPPAIEGSIDPGESDQLNEMVESREGDPE